jgi:hypothetical protein
MEESVRSFDVDELEGVPDAVGKAVRELERQGVRIVEGPTIKRVETPDGERWSITFLVEGPVES